MKFLTKNNPTKTAICYESLLSSFQAELFAQRNSRRLRTIF
ncbi:hypothetical protein T09_14344 [Trichinella sp. T9]|nr:hypothetical protein T09_14344 [Trichinella sp. T9]